MRSDGLVFGIFHADTDTSAVGQASWSTSGWLARRDAGAAARGGAEVDDETQEQEGIGRFGWAADPEGNRFELWEPAEGM